MSEAEESQRETVRLADAVCATDPVQAGVRDELLKLEKWATEDGYTPGDPRMTHMFQVVVNRATNQVESMPMRVMTEVVRHFAEMLDGMVPASVELVSRILSEPESFSAMMTPAVTDSIRFMLTEYRLADGWEFYGFGICTTCLSLRSDVPNAEEIARRDDSDEHPETRPLWYAHLVGGDLRVWSVLHQRGYDVVYGTSGPDEATQDFPELTPLMRFVAAAQPTA